MNIDACIEHAEETGELSVLRGQSVLGFGSNDQRCKIWMKLLSISEPIQHFRPSFSHQDHHQILIDVDRRYQKGSPKYHELVETMMTVLEKNPTLSYYQGFDYLADTVLQFADVHLAAKILEQLALGPLSTFFQRTFNGATILLKFAVALLQLIEPEIAETFKEDVMAFFIADIITWFTATFPSLRILDFLVASHPLMPVYLEVAFIHVNRDFFSGDELDSTDFLQSLRQSVCHSDLTEVFLVALKLFEAFSPKNVLRSDRSIILSPDCHLLSPNLKFPFPISDFPAPYIISRTSYEKRLVKRRRPVISSVWLYHCSPPTPPSGFKMLA